MSVLIDRQVLCPSRWKTTMERDDENDAQATISAQVAKNITLYLITLHRFVITPPSAYHAVYTHYGLSNVVGRYYLLSHSHTGCSLAVGGLPCPIT